MELNVLYKNARCISFEIVNGDIFNTQEEYSVFVNGTLYKKTNTVVNTVFNLKPDCDYEIAVKGSEESSIKVHTDYEFVTLNVKEFGAKGDGESDDTIFIQAAIMACPKEGRVLIPEGVYRITSLFLKDDLKLELAENAVLSAITDREKFPIFQGLIESYDEKDEYNLGTWEGNPLPMFTGIVTGVNVKNVNIYGAGMIEGNASFDNWWYNAKVMRGAFRPRMIFLNHCENVSVVGIKVQNSPSWNIHPYFSNDLKFIDLKVLNPKDSPNTDGLDPESCKNVEITGVYFSLGDDCIAVKSGKIYMGAKYKTPSENLVIRQCCMRDGHGSVTIGSEMAGGVINLTVQDCLFINTDRGLRIKTRRGRGKDAIIDGIHFKNIKMDDVMTPFVINCFYYCDPDGHSEYVSDKNPHEVDERTPDVKKLVFENIDAKNCHIAAAFMYGLPEKKIEEVQMKNINVTYAQNPKTDVPAMMDGIEPINKMGIYANNIEKFVVQNVNISGQNGEALNIINSNTCVE